MNKAKARHQWRYVRKLKPWYLLVLTVLSLCICVYALRANNEHMLKLRNAVYSADEKNDDVYGALVNLQKYVTAHMNTSLTSGPNSVYPPIQLKNTYNRIVNQQNTQLSNQNSNLYTQAENYCQAQIPTGFSGRYRVGCIEQYIDSHSLQKASINQALYEFDFVSPVWSPDLAGWSLLTTIALGFLFLVSLVVDWRFKKYLT